MKSHHYRSPMLPTRSMQKPTATLHVNEIVLPLLTTQPSQGRKIESQIIAQAAKPAHAMPGHMPKRNHLHALDIGQILFASPSHPSENAHAHPLLRQGRSQRPSVRLDTPQLGVERFTEVENAQW